MQRFIRNELAAIGASVSHSTLPIYSPVDVSTAKITDRKMPCVMKRVFGRHRSKWEYSGHNLEVTCRHDDYIPPALHILTQVENLEFSHLRVLQNDAFFPMRFELFA